VGDDRVDFDRQSAGVLAGRGVVARYPDDGRLPTAEAVADRLAALRP
jgi:hypothetical protein